MSIQKTNLARLLATFSASDLAAFQKFVQSPFFNARPETIKLYDNLLPHLRAGRSLPEKTAIWPRIFGHKTTYDDHRIRMTISFLYQLACQYLAIQQIQNNKSSSHLALAQSFRQRGVDGWSSKQLEMATTFHQEKGCANADMQEERYQLLLEQYRLAIGQRTSDPAHLRLLNDTLDISFIARKLWQSCFLLSHQTVQTQSFDFGTLSMVLQYVESRPVMLEVPAIAIYYHCYKALTDPEETEHFHRFRSVMKTTSDIFPPDELRDVFVLALNFCSRQYNTGKQEYLPDQFNLYQEGLEKGYFLTEGYLSPLTYQNAATIALILNENDWLEWFIHEYRPMLPADQREGLFHFNQARLAFQRRDTDLALDMLQKVEYKDLPLNLAAKALQLKIYFENEEYRLLDSHIGAFQSFIRRRKDIGPQRSNYQHLLNFTQKMLEIPRYDKEARQTLRQKIEDTPGVAEKGWLRKMINDK